MIAAEQEQLFLVGGTAMEREHVARDRGVHPTSIKLVTDPKHMRGHRGGQVILAAGHCDDLEFVLDYAVAHGIRLP